MNAYNDPNDPGIGILSLLCILGLFAMLAYQMIQLVDKISKLFEERFGLDYDFCSMILTTVALYSLTSFLPSRDMITTPILLTSDPKGAWECDLCPLNDEDGDMRNMGEISGPIRIIFGDAGGSNPDKQVIPTFEERRNDFPAFSEDKFLNGDEI